ncbi:MAG: hypothetical protein WBM40_10310 [Thiohalocapsa sp.]
MDRKAVAIAFRALDGGGQMALEQEPIGQRRQRIMVGEMLDLGLGPPALADVIAQPLHHHPAMVALAEQLALVADVDRMPIAVQHAVLADEVQPALTAR